MATRGRKAKPAALRLLQGGGGHRPLPPDGPPVDGKPVMPRWLEGRAVELWHEVVSFASWLTRADSYKLASWCAHQALFETEWRGWTAADKREHRACGGELGLDPASRRSLAVPSADAPADPRTKYLA